MPFVGAGQNRAQPMPTLAAWALGCAVVPTVGTTRFPEAAASPLRVEIGAGVLGGIREGAGGDLSAFNGIPYDEAAVPAVLGVVAVTANYRLVLG